MTERELRALVAQASLAPSVHNVQPARWRLGSDELQLFEEMDRRLRVGDPDGHDAGISLGAAAEGLRLAAAQAGLRADRLILSDEDLLPELRPVARFRLTVTEAPADPLAVFVQSRSSWRGNFAKATSSDRGVARTLQSDVEGVAVVSDSEALREIAELFDAASYGFIRQAAFRSELVGWMRLSPRHPRWSADGLNADAMAMSRLESLGAGAVLGLGFGVLDRIGVASTLLAEGSKVAGAAAVAVLHRPKEETPFDSGANFYRAWLCIEQAGFGAAVLAALADDPQAADQVARLAGVPKDRRVVSAFRLGRRPPGVLPTRVRRQLGELMV